MLEIERGRFFKKDEKKLKLSDTQFKKYILYISMLVKQEPLPKEAQEHSLTGEWKDCREFHIGGDMVVIYRIDKKNSVLQLIRIGSHSQLFKKF
ncbi:MAG: type II toxin-antitoxin system YafQ family toxin [Epsilonproteobacteria bacterium]|nr:type II toxin-antitoxin system YafQ family toxin [Campylobacterota bacterium]